MSFRPFRGKFTQSVQQNLRKPAKNRVGIELLEERPTPAAITGGTRPGGIESTVAPSAMYYLDSSAGVTTSGSNVTAWNSQSAGGRNFTQGTAAAFE